MANILYHYDGCSTCKKAIAFLKAKGVEFERVDLVEKPPHVEVLRDLWQRSGKPIDKLFNISGMSYRDGNFSVRIKRMKDDDKLAALAYDGKLVKRPIIDLGDTVLIGFNDAEWTAATER